MCIDLFRFKSNALDEQVIKAKLKKNPRFCVCMRLVGRAVQVRD